MHKIHPWNEYLMQGGGGGGGGAAQQQKQQEERMKQMEDMKNGILSQVLTQEARFGHFYAFCFRVITTKEN